MKGEVGDEFPLLPVGLPFEGAEPMVNAIFCETWASLRGEDVGALCITTTMLDVVIQGTTYFIQQINVSELFPFVSNMKPANLWTHMGVLHEQIRNITHATACPIAQSKQRLAAHIISFLDQVTQHKALIW